MRGEAFAKGITLAPLVPHEGVEGIGEKAGFSTKEEAVLICPECGCPTASHLKDIFYPKGAVTQLLECPECNKIVLQGRLPGENPENPKP